MASKPPRNKRLMRRLLRPPRHPPKSAKSLRNHHETRNPAARRHVHLHPRTPNATPATPDDDVGKSLKNQHETHENVRKRQAPDGVCTNSFGLPYCVLSPEAAVDEGSHIYRLHVDSSCVCSPWTLFQRPRTRSSTGDHATRPEQK